MLTLSADYQPYISLIVGDPSLPQANRTGNGYARFAPASPTMLTDVPAGGVSLPLGARHAWISVANNAIRARSDGVAPTTNDGLLIPANTLIQVEDQATFLQQFRFIDAVPGNASEVSAMYFA